MKTLAKIQGLNRGISEELHIFLVVSSKPSIKPRAVDAIGYSKAAANIYTFFATLHSGTAP
jgi:hypothetical protein